MFRGHTAETLASLVEGYRGVVSLDPNVRPSLIDERACWSNYHSRWISRANIYKASDEDIDYIWPDREPSAVAAELIDRGVSIVAVTQGRDGAVIYTSSHEVPIAGRYVPVADTVGAGDAFAAAMLVGLWRTGFDDFNAEVAEFDRGVLYEIGSSAVLAGALACTRRGAVPPTQAELDS